MLKGGVLEGDSADVKTMDNSAALRESLNRIFSESIGKKDEVQIIVEMQGGYKNVCKEFLKKKDAAIVMFIDSDCPLQNRVDWFEKLKDNDSIDIPKDFRANIYFMIQEMEAWILKDLTSIERWAEREGLERTDRKPLEKHSLVYGKEVECISKPNDKLAQLVKHFFKKNGKKVRYGKLKTAPAILDCIDVKILKSKDAELTRFSMNFNKEQFDRLVR